MTDINKAIAHVIFGDDSFLPTNWENDARIAKIKALVVESLPPKIKLSTSVYQNIGDGLADERIGYKHGFDDCLGEIRSIYE